VRYRVVMARRVSRAFRRAANLFVTAALVWGCKPRASGVASTAASSVPSAAAAVDALQPLRDFETTRRASTDFARFPPSDATLGSDPYTLLRIPPSLQAGRRLGVVHSPSFLGLLRGRSAIVTLDESLREMGRLDAPTSASSIAITKEGDVFVAGDLSHTIQRFRFAGEELHADGRLDLPDVRAIRGLAAGPEGVIYGVEEHDGRLLTLTLGGEGNVSVKGADSRDAPIPFRRVDVPIGHGPLRVERVGAYVLVDCLLDHAIVIRRVDRAGVPTARGEVQITHDGPIWGFDAVETPKGGLLVAAGGVEDHPLDRTEGSFGFIDSFVYLYRVEKGVATRLAAINTSALGLITPKAIHLSRGANGSVEVTVLAYGSDRSARLVWAQDPSEVVSTGESGPVSARRPDQEPQIMSFPCPPGSASVASAGDGSFAVANPLLDAWVRVTPTGPGSIDVVHVADSKDKGRSVDSRVGEALFFTSLMAPWDKSEGRLSRFTCETCHFEGYVDGRTHHTGRGDIAATTKPLLGLFNNKPHFSRALDPDLTTVANNEFRVAGAKSDHDPWFSLSVKDFPWIGELGAGDEAWTPVHLRRALMTFLMDFSHRPNPSVLGRATWLSTERAGAEVFRDRCESCHAARLVADDPSTRVPFENWESFVMAREGAIVWAGAEYEKTGVEPYVNEKGARVVSLRRLFKKYPYFTNGSAKSLLAVLDRVRYSETIFFHDGALDRASLVALTAAEKSALLAFLDLL
jgi:hypothetical protein